jgi:hypothetical protein
MNSLESKLNFKPLTLTYGGTSYYFFVYGLTMAHLATLDVTPP